MQRHAVEHRADAFGDRQLDADAPRQVAQHRRGGQPLDDLADLRPRLVGRRAARDQLARAAVAAERVEARRRSGRPCRRGPENVSGSAPQASPSRAISTSPRVMSADFALSPSPSPSTAPADEGDHVLRGAAELDADQVAVDVDAERARVDRLLQAQRERFVLRGDHGRARQAGRDLLRHVRPREHGHRADRARGSRAGCRSPGSRPLTRLRTGASPRTWPSTSRNALLGTAMTTRSASSYGASSSVTRVATNTS